MIGNVENEDALHMLHMVCKVFYKANHIMLAPQLMEPGVIDPWFQFFKSILDMPVPDHLLTKLDKRDEMRQRNKAIQWKIKGMVGKITFRLFIKYGDVDLVESQPQQ